MYNAVEKLLAKLKMKKKMVKIQITSIRNETKSTSTDPENIKAIIKNTV